MNNYIKITTLKKQQNRIEIKFETSKGLQQYFKQTLFWYEMKGVGDVPDDVAIIPFVCDVLPVVWLTNSHLRVDTIDKTFYECINEIKVGYIAMYPMLDFKGSIVYNNLKENYYDARSSVVMFSGGIDAICTTIRHIEERPYLLSVWGSADFPISDTEGWSRQWNNLKFNSELLGLECHYIKSNFCEFMNLWPNLQNLIKKTDESWWHGFLHGIGILSHSVPFAYIHHCKIVYMASSYHETDCPFTCASDPTIDSKMKFASTDCFHDAFEISRQDKVAVIVKYAKEQNVKFKIHVCLRQNQSNNNCCKCEKCYRTILELLAEGADPHDFGFDNYDLDDIFYDIEHNMVLPKTAIPFYQQMCQKAILGGGKNAKTRRVAKKIGLRPYK